MVPRTAYKDVRIRSFSLSLTHTKYTQYWWWVGRIRRNITFININDSFRFFLFSLSVCLSLSSLFVCLLCYFAYLTVRNGNFPWEPISGLFLCLFSPTNTSCHGAVRSLSGQHNYVSAAVSALSCAHHHPWTYIYGPCNHQRTESLPRLFVSSKGLTAWTLGLSVNVRVRLQKVASQTGIWTRSLSTRIPCLHHSAAPRPPFRFINLLIDWLIDLLQTVHFFF